MLDNFGGMQEILLDSFSPHTKCSAVGWNALSESEWERESPCGGGPSSTIHKAEEQRIPTTMHILHRSISAMIPPISMLGVLFCCAVLCYVGDIVFSTSYQDVRKQLNHSSLCPKRIISAC